MYMPMTIDPILNLNMLIRASSDMKAHFLGDLLLDPEPFGTTNFKTPLWFMDMNVIEGSRVVTMKIPFSLVVSTYIHYTPAGRDPHDKTFSEEDRRVIKQAMEGLIARFEYPQAPEWRAMELTSVRKILRNALTAQYAGVAADARSSIAFDALEYAILEADRRETASHIPVGREIPA